MAIFGESAPRFKASDDTVVDLDNCQVTRNEPDYDRVVHQSKLSGDRNVITRGYHWVFECIEHLHKYSSPTPETKFNTINGFLNDEVKILYRHRENYGFRDSSNVDVPFVLVEVTPYAVTDKFEYEDAIRMKFISTKFVDIQKSTVSIP